MINKEPIRDWFPELNSLQLARLREMLKAEYQRGLKDAAQAI